MTDPVADGRATGGAADTPTHASAAPGPTPGPKGPTGPVGDRTRRLLPVGGLLVGACATLPVLGGPHLDVARAVEIADHIIPGLVVLAVSAAVLLTTRWASISGTALFAAGLVVVLAGLWMATTHLPLVAQAARHEAPWGATIYHNASALLVLALGLVWTAMSWADAG